MTTRFGSPSRQTEAQIALNKRKRWQSRSDEEIESEMDHRNLPYRTGWPVLTPLPLETETTGARDSIENTYQHLKLAYAILNVQKVNVANVFFAFRVPKDISQDDPRELYHTLVITVRGMPSNAQQAIIRIRSLFKTNRATELVHIEMIDCRVLHGLHTIHIGHSEHAIIDAWDGITDIVGRELGRLGQEWLCLEFERRGLDDENCRLTVVITTPTATDMRWWHTVIPALQAKSYGTLSLQFEVLSASTLEGTPTTRAGIPIPREELYHNAVAMGSSVGISGVGNSAGTVGGAVTLSNGQTYGLTNFHVVREDYLDRANSGRNPLYPGNALESRPQEFVTPADSDYKAAIELLKDYKSDIESGPQAAVDKLNAKIASLEARKRDLGKLYAASGYRALHCEEFGTDLMTGRPKRQPTKPPRYWPLDWALLSIKPPRFTTNYTPEVYPVRSGPPTAFWTGGADYCGQWTTCNSGTAPIKRSEVTVAKFGRTTEWTFGEIVPVMVCINLEASQGMTHFAKAYDFDNERVGYCYRIESRDRQREFVKPGDSGSIIVHDPSGAWLGILFGQNREDDGLMMPIEMIFRDIENITGLTVTRPAFTSNAIAIRNKRSPALAMLTEDLN